MAIIFLVLSVIAAGLATLVLFVVFQSLERSVKKKTEARADNFVEIVVAKQTIEQGTTLNKDLLEHRRVPDAFFLDTMADSIEAIEGRVPQERVLAGEPLRTERLADPEAGRGLTALIPKGQRALQIELRGAQAVAGFVNPGDFVDVLFTGTDPKKKKPHTRTLLQAKEVLAVDERLALDDQGSAATGRVAPSVTLALTPVEAQMVTHAQRTGTLTLTLRNHVDVTRQEVHGVAPGEFIGAANKPVRVKDVARNTPRPGPQVITPDPEPVQDPNKVRIIEGATVREVEERTPAGTDADAP